MVDYLWAQDMQDALELFGCEAEQIIASFVRTLESQKPAPIIYHYTDDVGLRGILETGQLWLTNVFNLNDPSELSHGLSHAVKILNSKAAKGPLESKLFAEDLAAFIEQRGIQKSGHYFLCSFSSCGAEMILVSGALMPTMDADMPLGLIPRLWKMPSTSKEVRRY